MQYCLHLLRNVNKAALENVDVTTYILHPFAMSNHLAGYLKFNSSIVYNVYLLSSLGFFTDTKGGVDHSLVSAVTTEH